MQLTCTPSCQRSANRSQLVSELLAIQYPKSPVRQLRPGHSTLIARRRSDCRPRSLLAFARKSFLNLLLRPPARRMLVASHVPVNPPHDFFLFVRGALGTTVFRVRSRSGCRSPVWRRGG